MTNEQKSLITAAESAYVAALAAGVPQKAIISAVFEAANKWQIEYLKEHPTERRDAKLNLGQFADDINAGDAKMFRHLKQCQELILK